MSPRKIIFWLHLIAGVVAGVSILIMCVTGTAIAFEKEAIAAAEKSVAKVTPPAADAARLPLEDLLAKVAETKPGSPSGVTVFADPAAAVLVAFGRTNTVYVNPYSGEAKEATATTTRGLMRTLTDWHRWLGREGDGRAVGKAINGACNTAFLFLALSGLILWAPRAWSWASVRAVTVLKLNARGKARDWNWHNVLGFWSSPILIVLTVSGMVISYKWAGDLVYKVAGSPIPATGGPGAASPAPEVPKPEPGVRPMGRQAQLAAAQKAFPNWEQITFRTGGPSGGGARVEGQRREGERGEAPRGENREVRNNSEARREEPKAGETQRSEPREGQRNEQRDGGHEGRNGGEGQRSGEGRGGEGGARRGPQAISISLKERGQWPLFSSTTAWLDPFTGALLRKETFADFNAGRQARTWLRFLHTGEAFGLTGKVIAAAASAFGAVLVWTGFALAWRRFMGWKNSNRAAQANATASTPEPATLSQ